MKKFVITCPECGSYVEASTGVFAKKKVVCACGCEIDVNQTKMSKKKCPHCGNEVVYDQSKGEEALCPVCHKKINASADKVGLIKITCPSCACELTTDKNAEKITCVLCGSEIDVQKRIAQEKIKNSNAVSDIKWDSSEGVLVWKHPVEDFNMGTQLTVHASQEALFFRDGRALDLFGAGRYTLETQKIPMLSEIYKLPPDADRSLHSEVYFFNKTVQTGIKWGTPSRVRIIEPVTNMPVEIGARGTFNLEISDARKLILKLVGTASAFGTADVVDSGKGYSVEYMRGKFSDMIAMHVTSLLARVIMENNLRLYTIDIMKPQISAILAAAINRELEAFGLHIPEGQFYVTDILNDDENYKQIIEQDTAAVLEIHREKLAVAKEEAVRARTMAELETKAKANLFETQVEAESARISSLGVADSTATIAQGEAQRIKLEGGASADVYRAQAMAEAEEMHLKGYSQKDVLQTDVQKAYANALGQMGANGGGTGGGMLGDVAGLGVALGAMGSVIDMTKEAMTPMMNMGATAVAPTEIGWTCVCGKKNIMTRFCPDCGAAKPATVDAAWDCACGRKGIATKFCPDCGTKREV